MEFLNPFDLAKSIDIDNISSSSLKKFKRRLLAELDLSDNEI